MELLSTIIGIALGWIGQLKIGEYKERKEKEKLAIRNYIFNLQDASYSLYKRLNNIKNEGGGSLMTEDYETTSTLFSIGRIIASDILMKREGIYLELQTWSQFIKQIRLLIKQINGALDEDIFFHYHRLEIAEISISGAEFISYHQFKKNLRDPELDEAVNAFRKLKACPSLNVKELILSCKKMVQLLQIKTNYKMI